MFLRTSKEKKKQKSDKVDKADKLVDPSSVFVIGRAPTDEHVESMDMSEPSHFSALPDSLEAQFQKFNELFASHFSRLESLLAKVGSQEQIDHLVFHTPHPPFFCPCFRDFRGSFLVSQFNHLSWPECLPSGCTKVCSATDSSA